MSHLAHLLPRPSHLRGMDDVPTRADEVTGWKSLTASQSAVVELVCEGLTNPQIGERLSLSPRTVQRHLHTVFRKVGVATRTELAVKAVVAGVAAPDRDQDTFDHPRDVSDKV